MSFKTTAAIGVTWLLLVFIGAICDGTMQSLQPSLVQGGVSDNGTAINVLLNGQVFSVKDIPFVDIGLPWPNGDFFLAIARLMIFDFSYFKGDYIIGRWILLLAIGFPMGWQFFVLIFSNISFLIGSIRSRIPFLN